MVPRDRSAVDILIFEEDHPTLALLQQWLAEAGYRVHVGMSCDGHLGSSADLIIANVSMPKHGGARCIRNIRETYPHTPVIAISSQFRPGLSAAGAAAQALGAQKVLAKPLLRSELVSAVREMVHMDQ